MTEVRQGQLDEAHLARSSLLESHKLADMRRGYYADLLEAGPLSAEVAERLLLLYAGTASLYAGIVGLTSSTISAIPQTYVGICAGVELGGTQAGAAVRGVAEDAQSLAAFLRLGAAEIGTTARWQRREQDWTLQHDLAKQELKQLAVQLKSADKRIELAQRELDNHRTSVRHSREIDQQLRSRFTNQDLYDWMVQELTTLVSQNFQLALEVARKAEVCFRRERGRITSDYVRPNAWNATRKGLLAAEKLLADLNRMEVAYVEEDRRELEVTKHVSLKRLDPDALFLLQHLGQCDFEIPEVLFDLDFPGQYFRRIKAVTISIPCVAGPYSGVNGVLTLTNSQVRRDDGQVDTERWTERIALSQGRDDGGMFTFDFRDARYLPFEHRGAISTWHLELAGAGSTPRRPQFDWLSVADVVLTVRYTARYNASLRPAALTGIPAGLNAMHGGSGMQVVLSLRYDAPDAWNSILTTTPNPGGTLEVALAWSHFPYVVQYLTSPSVKAAEVLLVAGPQAPGQLDPTLTVTIGGRGFIVPAAPYTQVAGHTTRTLPCLPDSSNPVGTPPDLEPALEEGMLLQITVAPDLTEITTDGMFDPEKLADVLVILTLNLG